MKNRFLVAIIFLSLLPACSDEQAISSQQKQDTPAKSSSAKDTAASPAKKDTAQKSPAEKTAAASFNQKDKLGRKQGKWMTRFSNGLPGYEYWRNDTLEGYFKFWFTDSATDLFMEGRHRKGKLDSIAYRYENKKLYNATQWRDGKWTWFAFVGNAAYILPVKDMGINTDDSVLVDCPYGNGQTWYRGYFFKRKEVGIHYGYREDGTLRYKYDYDHKKVFYYDRKGRLKETMGLNVRGVRVPEDD